MFMKSFLPFLLFGISVLTLLGCTGSDDSANRAGGLPASGGKVVSVGGRLSGGSLSTGGTLAAAGGSVDGGGSSKGGITLLGGTLSTGGMTASGGIHASGGMPSFGGSRIDVLDAGRDFGSETLVKDMGVAGEVHVDSAIGGMANSGGTTGTGGVNASGGTTHTGKWIIMPVGDSITGTTCYPQLLSKNLIAEGHSNFELVGSVLNNQACQASHVQTEGHGGWLVTSLLPNGSNANVQAKWFADEKPEIVILHFATNDLWNNVPPSSILSAYSLIVDSARAAVPNVIFFVAQVIPLAPSSCSDCPARTSTLNAQIPAWAAGKSKSNSPIHVVDLASGWVSATDTGDGVHPNLIGSKKMAEKITQAIIGQKLF